MKMLRLKPLAINWLAVDAHIPTIIFIMPPIVTKQKLAHALDSLVRVSRRVKWSIMSKTMPSAPPQQQRLTMGHTAWQKEPSSLTCVSKTTPNNDWYLMLIDLSLQLGLNIQNKIHITQKPAKGVQTCTPAGWSLHAATLFMLRHFICLNSSNFGYF